MGRPWGPIPLAVLGLLGALAALPSAAIARRTVAHAACGKHNRGKVCLGILLDKGTSGRTVAKRLPQPLAAAGACANPTLRPTADNLGLVRTAVLCLINGQRALAGVGALRADAHLTSAAQRHSNDMARSGDFDHTGSAGDTVGRRIGLSGYLQSGRAATLAENLAWVPTARDTAAAMVANWLVSPEHRVNLLDAGFRDTGIGLALMAQSGTSGVGITEDFGALR